MASHLQLSDQDKMQRMISRIAHEIIEREGDLDKVVLVGIKTRGEFLAQRIAKKLNDFEQVEVRVETLDITFYRDDLSQVGQEPELHSLPEFNVAGKRVIIVDDVMFTGRTLRCAIDAIMRCGRPEVIRFAVMVDRGHRELPFRADYVGKNIPTARHERIRVALSEIDECDQIALITK